MRDPRRRRLLILGAYPTQRRGLAALASDFEVVEGDSLRAARRKIRGRTFAGILVLVQDVADLAGAPAERTRGGAVPMLVVMPRVDAAIVNRAQLLDAQCVAGVDVRRHVRVFFERLARVPERRRLPAETQVARYAKGIPMSARQRELLTHVASGVRRKELPAAMGVKDSTIKTLARQVLRLLGASSVDDLAVAMARGEKLEPRKKPRRAS